MLSNSRCTTVLVCSLVAVGLTLPETAHARPAHKHALADYLGPFLARKLNDCRVCHQPAESTDPAADRPHNPFGSRLKEVRKQLREQGKEPTIAARVDAVAGEDADGDGAGNLAELLLGHNPGDPSDRPSAEELAGLAKTGAAFVKFQKSYPWRPFEPVVKPGLPAVRNRGWVRNAVDVFLAAGHEEQGLTPQPEAPRAVLLRRVAIDLTGLPPTPAELNAFLNDPSSDAYERAVDRLLASPHYGERWGRHWMDVWRYSDWAGWTGGGQIRDSQPHIWRWRDWIIESLNNDKGYDRMVVEMLAADEVAPDDTDTLRATGFLVRNYKMLSREKWMQDVVDHTFMGFLGITMGCARCHDHMFDPITQHEYYQARAIFEPHKVRLDRLPGEPDTKKDGLARAYDADPNVPTYFYERGDERTPDKSATLKPGVPVSLKGTWQDPQPVSLPREAFAPDKQAFVIAETLADARQKITTARESLAAAQNKHAAAVAGGTLLLPVPAGTLAVTLPVVQSAHALAVVDEEVATLRLSALEAVLAAERLEDAGKKDSPEWKQAATNAVTVQRQQTRAEARRNLLAAGQTLLSAVGKAKDAAEKQMKAASDALAKAEAVVKQPSATNYTPRPGATYPTTSTGRRLALAQWITARDNPLAARVAVNHIWLRHFGQGLVPSAADFGRNGRRPTHPALLDWLAAEFMDHGWSMKHLHRLIVTSAAYRTASTYNEASAAIDRDNLYLWRMPTRRLEAELVRDAVFFVAGKLDDTMGGPDIDHNQGLTVPRRSVYFRHAAEKQMLFLQLFDCAGVTECYERKESIMPQQALALVNSELTLQMSRLLARELAAEHADAAAFTVAAFTRVLSRPATPAEVAECVGFLQEQTERHAKQPAKQTDGNGKLPASDPALRARENLVHVLMNHNDFVTVR